MNFRYCFTCVSQKCAIVLSAFLGDARETITKVRKIVNHYYYIISELSGTQH